MLASFPYTTAMLLTLFSWMLFFSVPLSSSETKPMNELSGVWAERTRVDVSESSARTEQEWRERNGHTKKRRGTAVIVSEEEESEVGDCHEGSWCWLRVVVCSFDKYSTSQHFKSHMEQMTEGCCTVKAPRRLHCAYCKANLKRDYQHSDIIFDPLMILLLSTNNNERVSGRVRSWPVNNASFSMKLDKNGNLKTVQTRREARNKKVSESEKKDGAWRDTGSWGAAENSCVKHTSLN